MFIKKILITVLLLTSSVSMADESRDVPKKLFGISLGGIYDLGDPDDNDLGNLPVKKFTSLEVFMGQGVHYYFQPNKEYKIFKYVEYVKKPEDHFFKTSFRLYLLPVIPSTITTNEQFNKVKLNWEVTSIQWWDYPGKLSELSVDAKEKLKREAYYWAIDLCKTFKVDISVKPEIYNNNLDYYECTFSHGDREFKVTNRPFKNLKLSYKDEVFNKKDEAVEKMIRKIEADEIRPY
jgi:hypothetical protein